MTKQPETLFKEKVLKSLWTIPNSWWFKTQEMATRGIPDIIGTIKGNFVAIELKVDSRLSKLQEYTLNIIRQTGALSFEMTPENNEKILTRLKKL